MISVDREYTSAELPYSNTNLSLSSLSIIPVSMSLHMYSETLTAFFVFLSYLDVYL